MDFSIFYFGDAGNQDGSGYELLMDGANFADTHGFAAVWTPERHFHRFGGAFANPAVTGAALAVATSRVEVRAGSVVWPLHHPLRVAEEWAMVDVLSSGRCGLSLASGWRAGDFVLRPEAYQDRWQLTVDGIDTLRRLWRGDPYIDESGAEYRIFPRPVTDEPRLWLTSSGNIDTFEAAGRSGVGILTHLIVHSVEELADKVARYRQAYAASGRPGRGHVALMVHTYLDESLEAAERLCREPLIKYLADSLDLGVIRLNGRGARLTPGRRRLIAEAACDRYLHRDGLFGSVADAKQTIARIAASDVDEIACLIDFGVPAKAALDGLHWLAELRIAVG